MTLTIVPEESEVRFRIREQLANLPLPKEAVGTTKDVKGSVFLLADGTVDRERSKIEVDARTLKTDRTNRDRNVQREVLNTDKYPTVTFIPMEIKGLSGGVPTSGEGSLEMIGDLTVRDSTTQASWTGTAAYGEKEIMLSASLATSFSSLGINKPSVAIVLSVEENFVLEADLKLVRQDGAPAG